MDEQKTTQYSDKTNSLVDSTIISNVKNVGSENDIEKNKKFNLIRVLNILLFIVGGIYIFLSSLPFISITPTMLKAVFELGISEFMAELFNPADGTAIVFFVIWVSYVPYLAILFLALRNYKNGVESR